MKLNDFEALSFDCYGALIDWKTRIAAVLRAWSLRRGLSMTDEALLAAYATHEAAAKRSSTPTPTLPGHPGPRPPEPRPRPWRGGHRR